MNDTGKVASAAKTLSKWMNTDKHSSIIGQISNVEPMKITLNVRRAGTLYITGKYWDAFKYYKIKVMNRLKQKSLTPNILVNISV